MGNKAIFLDRDGTINADDGYFHEADKLELLPNVVEGLKSMPRGYLMIVVQNQAGIAKGVHTENDRVSVNDAINRVLSGHSVKIEEFYHCPHKEGDGCACRKPEPELVLRAARDFGIDLNKSWFIGDSTRDMQLVARIRSLGHAGFRSIGLLTGNALKDGRYDATPDFIAKDLSEAAHIIISHGGL